ncbi:hypothetical protein NL108_013401 [Boleophthalmus pectinirostris]|nr:hypothetical protein NL108_013401 [Boleophthalmus pectinirostris]
MLTQKFCLDWAEGRTNQDIQLLFPFTFRELNVLRDQRFSLVELLHHFFSESKVISNFEDLQVLFIFDGLDECRLPLDFSRTRVLTDPTKSTSVHVLLINLIRRNLLSSAKVWITTRPAAASQIPASFISMVTEVRGFTDLQKEQYFIRRFRDEEQATAVISHIKKSHSLYIMCYIPVFCWIISTVLHHVMKTDTDELPQTFTQMYIHFLVIQAKIKNLKYDGQSETDPQWTNETVKMVKSLGKLAFDQLLKGNLIFYESDLKHSGLNTKAASVYSGLFTQVFREEQGLYHDKVYCFIHLSVQEFLAALHVHQTFVHTGVNLLSTKQPINISLKRLKGKCKLKDLHHSAVDQALKSPNGHLDLFLRFLLGLSLPENQRLLQGFLLQKSEVNQETVEYIHEKINQDLSAERCVNLFHCLNELKDYSLVLDIQRALTTETLKAEDLSPSHWSALAFLLLTSSEDLEEFDLEKYSSSETALLRLLPVIKASKKALLRSCNLSEETCDPLSSVLSSQTSCLQHLDLSYNNLQDSAVELLCEGLASPNCKLETIILSQCSLSQSCCGHLASVLTSSRIQHLDLSNNDIQDSGVELLFSGLKTTVCKLLSLNLSGCMVSEKGGTTLVKALSYEPCYLMKLDLSYNNPGPSALQVLKDLWEHRDLPLDSLRLKPAGVHWLTEGISKYYCVLTLDVNTSYSQLKVSDDRRTVTDVKTNQNYPDHPHRFAYCPQILCSTPLTGRCYWELYWEGEVDIAVSYRGISRKKLSKVCKFGKNDQSWSLKVSDHKYTESHPRRKAYQSPTSSGHVAVYLDHSAGSLSFFSIVNEELVHIHTFYTTFIAPLFAGFGFLGRSTGSSVCLDDVPTELGYHYTD